MAQPVGLIFEYLGGISVKKNTTISTADAPSGADVIIFKSPTAKVFVDGTDAFTVKYGEVSYFSTATNHTYTFTEDVDLAFAKYIAIGV